MKENSRVKKAYKNIVWGIFNKITTIIGPFIIRSLLIKVMGGEYAGIGSLFTSILQVLNLAELGVSSAIVFSMYKPIADNNEKLISQLYNFYRKVYLLIGMVILISGIILTPFIPTIVNGNIPSDVNLIYLYLIYLLNTVISYFFFGYKESLLVANQRNDIVSNLSTVSNIFMYFIQVICILKWKNYYLYTIIIPVSTLLNNVLKSILVNKKYPNIRCSGKLNKNDRNILFKNIVGLLLTKISQVFRNSFDSIFISMFLGLMAVTKYQNYYYIMNSISVILMILCNSVISGVGNSIATESVEKNHNDFKKFYFLYNWISCWCTICLFCLFQDFMKIWLGEKYLLSNSIVLLFCIYFYSMRIGDIASVYRQAAGLWWDDKFRPIVESICNLILNYLFVKYLGVAGVLLSTIITILFINIPWSSIILFKNYFKKDVRTYFYEMLKDSLILLICGSISFYICNLVVMDNIFISFIIKVFICILVPNLLFILIYKNSKLFKESKALVLRMIGR